MGLVQIATAVWGGIISVKSLPPTEKRFPHLSGFIALGIAGVALTFWIGAQSYESERQAEKAQNQLINKLENQNGQLAAIAGMLKVNSTDPSVLAGALAQALHPPEKLPCLNPVRFTSTQKESQSGYDTLVRISNPTGIRANTRFQFFFTTSVGFAHPVDKDVSWSGGSGTDIGFITVSSEIPKGKALVILAGGALIPAQVKCVDRFDPEG